MKKNLSYCTLLLLFIFNNEAYAQDPIFTQFFVNQIYTNPAMTGTAADVNGKTASRFVLNYRNQWPSEKGTFTTINLAWDKQISALRGGLGFMLNRDIEGPGAITTNSVTAMYAYSSQLSKKLFLNAGIKMSFVNRHLDFNRIPLTDPTYPIIDPNQPIPDPNVYYPNFGAGLMTYSQHFYVGLAVHNIFEPNNSFYGSRDGIVPRRYTLHGGGVIKPFKSKIHFYPDMQLNIYQKFNVLQTGVNVNIHKIVFGYQAKTAVGSVKSLFENTGVIGYKSNKFLALYSLGYVKIGNEMVPTHEVSMRYLIAHKNSITRETGVSRKPWL